MNRFYNFNIGLRTFWHEGLSEPEIWPRGDIVYKFRKFLGRTDFSDQFRKVLPYKRTGFNLNVMQQST